MLIRKMQETWSVGQENKLQTQSNLSKVKGKHIRTQSEDIPSTSTSTSRSRSRSTSRSREDQGTVVGDDNKKETGTEVETEIEGGKSSPFVRSLSMSRNLALSVVDEVPHMIRLSPNPNDDPSAEVKNKKKPTLKKSSSASSLSRLLLLSSSNSSSSYAFSNQNQSAKTNGGYNEREVSTNSNSNAKSGPTSIPLPGSSSSGSSAGTATTISPSFEPESLSDSIGKLELRSLTDEASVKNLIGGKRNDLLVGVVVSRWDNIVGPQWVYVWTEERTSVFYPGNLSLRLSKLVKYVTDHTVDHHDVDGNLLIPSTLRSTLCIVRDLDLAYLSVSIRVPLNPYTESSYGFNHLMDPNRPASTVPHSVAVLANLQYLSHFLLLRPLILNWLSEFSPKIGVLLCKRQLQCSMINSWCAELCKTMTALRTCWWQESHCPGPGIKNAELASHGSSTMLSSTTGTGSTTGEPDDGSPTPSDYLPPSSLSKTVLEALLASFLTTFGSAIVVGEDAAVVNQVIRFLLCFVKDQEAYCSRYVLPTLPDTFMKGLYVQGLMLGEFGANNISYNQVTSSRHPFTYIELSRKQVKIRQTSIQSHRSQRDSILRDELLALWNPPALRSSNTDPFQQAVREGCSFINKFLEELRLLRPERRYARLLLFKRSLHAKAIALIAYLESIRTKDRLKGLKSITSALGFDDAEYSIVQVAAEKIRPGIQSIIRSK